MKNANEKRFLMPEKKQSQNEVDREDAIKNIKQGLVCYETKYNLDYQISQKLTQVLVACGLFGYDSKSLMSDVISESIKNPFAPLIKICQIVANKWNEECPDITWQPKSIQHKLGKLVESAYKSDSENNLFVLNDLFSTSLISRKDSPSCKQVINFIANQFIEIIKKSGD